MPLVENGYAVIANFGQPLDDNRFKDFCGICNWLNGVALEMGFEWPTGSSLSQVAMSYSDFMEDPAWQFHNTGSGAVVLEMKNATFWITLTNVRESVAPGAPFATMGSLRLREELVFPGNPVYEKLTWWLSHYSHNLGIQYAEPGSEVSSLKLPMPNWKGQFQVLWFETWEGMHTPLADHAVTKVHGLAKELDFQWPNPKALDLSSHKDLMKYFHMVGTEESCDLFYTNDYVEVVCHPSPVGTHPARISLKYLYQDAFTRPATTLLLEFRRPEFWGDVDKDLYELYTKVLFAGDRDRIPRHRIPTLFPTPRWTHD